MKRALPFLLALPLLLGAGRAITVASPRAVGRSAPYLWLLPYAPTPSQVAAGTLTGSRGETVTVTRATSRYCASSSSALVLLSANQPCVESAGLAVEGTHTNLVLQSQAFNSAPWAPQNGGTASQPITSANAGTAPDGTATAEKLDYPAVSGASSYSLTHTGSITVTSGATYTVSVWVRGVSGSGTLYLSIFDTSWRTVAMPYTTTWARFSLTRTVSAATIDVLVGVDLRDAAQATQPAQSVYVWQADLIASGHALSPVLTAGTSATGNIDAVTMAATALPIASGRIEFDFTPLWALPNAPSAILLSTGNGTGTVGIVMQILTDGTIRFYIGATLLGATSPLTWVPRQTYRFRLAWGGGAFNVWRDEVSVFSVAGATMPTSHTTLAIGSSGGGPIDGFVSNFRVTR